MIMSIVQIIYLVFMLGFFGLIIYALMLAIQALRIYIKKNK